jgi:hypothetical protein
MRAPAGLLGLLVLALLPGCGGLPGPVDAAQLPPGEFASGDPDVAALNYAAAAFSSQSSTYGDPAAGAEAALALEYSAGALNTAPRWVGIDPSIKTQMLRGRDEMRAAIGVAPGASSQAVVDALAAARRALQAGDKPAAEAALRNPAFTMTPDKTIEALANLPYLQVADAATLAAQDAVAGVPSGPPVSPGGIPPGFGAPSGL